jgi:hypothetical protein
MWRMKAKATPDFQRPFSGPLRSRPLLHMGEDGALASALKRALAPDERLKRLREGWASRSDVQMSLVLSKFHRHYFEHVG